MDKNYTATTEEVNDVDDCLTLEKMKEVCEEWKKIDAEKDALLPQALQAYCFVETDEQREILRKFILERMEKKFFKDLYTIKF